MKNFKPDEFPDDITLADPELLDRLDRLRDFMGSAIYPSPVPGALARTDLGAKSSQHYAVGRKSTAVDIFCAGEPFEAFIKILQSGLFQRVGVYFDTWFRGRRHVMFHIDLKPEKLLWFRNDGAYTYSHAARFHHYLFKFLFLNVDSH